MGKLWEGIDSVARTAEDVFNTKCGNMLSFVGKSSLVVCSLAPVSIGCSILYFNHCPPDWLAGIAFLAAGALAAVASIVLIGLCARWLQPVPMPVTKVKSADKESLSFLVAYLLPLAWRDSAGLPSNWLMGAYVLGILLLVVAHSNSFTFNPVLSLWRYHFYEIEDGVGGSFILVSKKASPQARQEYLVVKLAPGVFLDVNS